MYTSCCVVCVITHCVTTILQWSEACRIYQLAIATWEDYKKKEVCIHVVLYTKNFSCRYS